MDRIFVWDLLGRTVTSGGDESSDLSPGICSLYIRTEK